MPLNTTTITLHVVSASDLDRFVEEVYGTPYCTHAALEARNGDDHAADAVTEHRGFEDPEDPTSPLVSRPGLDPYDQEKLTAWQAGRPGQDPRPEVVLSDLACKGLILPAGT